MFWGECEKERLKRTYHTKLPQAISRPEKMDMSSLSQTYCAVATEDRKLVQSGGRAVRMTMKHMTMKQVVRLSKYFRQYASMGWSVGWKELDIKGKKDWHRSGGDYFQVLVLGSFRPRDYYRQVCLGEIVGYPNALPFPVLRLNDWAGQVRLAAIRAVLTCLEICPLDELFMTMVTLDKVRRSGRKDDRTAGTLPVFHKDDWLLFVTPQFLYQVKGPGV